MTFPRINPACGLLDDHFVFVTGGNFDDEFDSSETSEYFSLKTMEWKEGPSVDSEADGGKIVSKHHETYLIGNKHIYQLTKTGVERWNWKKVGDFDERENFAAFLITGDCKSWKDNAADDDPFWN